MIKKIQLISNSICYGPMPEEDQEIEQHLTICSDGRAWLSRYCYGNGDPYKLLSRQTKSIGKEWAGKILSAVEECFAEGFIPDFCTDIGSWDLKITLDTGMVISYCGSLCKDDRIEWLGISDMIRKALADSTVYAFVGPDEDDTEDADNEGVDYAVEYMKQTGKDLETGEYVMQ